MNNTKDKSISFVEIFRIFIKHLGIILLASAIVAGAVYAYLFYNYTEAYTSKSTIMVMNPEENLSASSTASYYSLTMTAVNDCELLMTSRSVLYQIIDELDLADHGITYSRLKSMISISGYPDSHVLEVSVTSVDPNLSKAIVDSLCRIGAAQIEDYIEFATAQVIDEGTLNSHPSNSVRVELAVIAGLVVAIMVFGIFMLVAIYDDRIDNSADVENKLGLSVLGIIPYCDDKKSKRMYTKR